MDIKEKRQTHKHTNNSTQNKTQKSEDRGTQINQKMKVSL